MIDLLKPASLLARSRIWKYRMLSTCDRVEGTPVIHQPVLFAGRGRIVIGRDVELGWPYSVGFYGGYLQLEALTPEAEIVIGDGAQINNNTILKAEGPGITIAEHALIGSGVTIYDSDFHDLHPDRRRGGPPAMGAVTIGRNAFIGDGAWILKGVEVGADTVVGAGSVVTRSLPAGVVAAGNPARVVREL